MKNYIAFLMALGVVSMQAASLDYPPLELWNKTDKPIYFAIASSKNMSDDKVMSEPLAELSAGKYFTGKSDLVDMSKYTRLLITQDPNAKSVTVYTFNPNKYMWVRVKEEQGKLVFGPQTGPYLGLLGDTERGYPLSKNIKSSDYKTETLSRSFAAIKESQKADTKMIQDVGVTKVDTDISPTVAKRNELLITLPEADRKEFESFSAEKFIKEPNSTGGAVARFVSTVNSVQKAEELLNWLKAVLQDPKLKNHARPQHYLAAVRKAIKEVENRIEFLKNRS